MATPTWTPFDSFTPLVFAHDVAALPFKLAFLTSGYVPSPLHSVWADVSAFEIPAANGYPAGGLADTNPSLITGQPGGTTQFHLDNVSFLPAPAGVTAHYVLVYADATVGSRVKPLVGYGLLDGSGVDVLIPAGGQPFVWYWSTLGVVVYATGAIPGPPVQISISDPQPPGVATPGVSGFASDAAHVHAPALYKSGVYNTDFNPALSAFSVVTDAGLAWRADDPIRFICRNTNQFGVVSILGIVDAVVASYTGTTLAVSNASGYGPSYPGPTWTGDTPMAWERITNLKPWALTATGAAAPAGGIGTAAGGWDTAANRDLAIMTLNNVQTRLDELEARLQELGILL